MKDSCKKTIRRLCAVLLAGLFLLLQPAVPVKAAGLYTPDFEVAAEAAILVNEETGAVVYAKNEDAPLTAASLNKMMTCILALDNIEDVDGTLVTADKTWIYDELYGKNASHADIRLGETLSVRELLYAMLLPSANEAALMLADYVCGGYMENFLFMMQARAEKLGCTNTTFVDPNGLGEGNLTTAHDMALIAREFFSYPLLAEIAAQPSYEMAAHEQHAGPYFITSTNRLIAPTSPYYSAFEASAGTVLGGKTGSLGEWQNFASKAVKGNESYICVLLHSPDAADAMGPALDPPQARPALYETARLYDWAFRTLSIRSALDTGQPITEIPVRYSTEQNYVGLLPADNLRTVLPNDADDSRIIKTFDIPEFLPAPVKQGDVVGSVTLTLEGQVIGSSQLLAAQDVDRNMTLFIMKKVGEFFGSTPFRIGVLVVLAGVGIYIGVVAWLVHKRKKQRAVPRQAARPPGVQRPGNDDDNAALPNAGRKSGGEKNN